MAIDKRRGPNATDLLLALGLLIGTLLRLVHLNAQSFWYDEAFSWVTSIRPLAEMIPALVEDFVHPPLHYMFLHGWLEFVHRWLEVVSNDAAAARLFVALFGIAALPAIYWLGCELYDRQTAAIGVVLLAISQLGIAYSQEVRPYSQLMFFTLVTTTFYVRAVERRSPAALLVTAIPAVLALATHYYAAFVIAGLALWHVFHARTRLPLWSIAVAFGLGIAFCLPWLLSGVVERALTSPRIGEVQPSYFSVNWQTPFENLAAFGNARLERVISPANSPWAVTVSSALFIAPVLLILRRPWMGRFLSIGLVVTIGILSGFGEWALLATFLVAALRGVDALSDPRLRHLATAAFVVVVLVVSVLAELLAAPLFVCFVLGLLAATPLRAWLPEPGSPDNDFKRSSLLASVVTVSLVSLLLAGTQGIQYDVRYTLAALAPFYLLTARALTLFTLPVLRSSWLAAIVVFSILGIRTHLEVPYKENYRDALALIHDRYQPENCVAFAPFWRTPIEWDLYGYNDVELRSLSEAELRDGASACREVWLVLYQRVSSAVERGKTVEAALAERRYLVAAQQFHWVRVGHFGAAKKSRD